MSPLEISVHPQIDSNVNTIKFYASQLAKLGTLRVKNALAQTERLLALLYDNI